jgi:hypothetical protein
MRFARPSGKAVALALGVALALLLSATTGAVAGHLITSDDILDQTIQSRDLAGNSVRAAKIAPGAVTWHKSLSEATRAQIEALAGQDGQDGHDGEDGQDGKDGAPGPTGPQGEPGPAGDDGRDGIDGIDGAVGLRGPAGVSLAALEYYGLWGHADGEPSATSTPRTELYGQHADRIQVTEPGVYLVSIQGIANDGDTDRAFVLGDHGTLYGDFWEEMQGCWRLIDELTCQSTFTLVVRSASPAAPHRLPLYITGDYGPACRAVCDRLLGLATVAVYKTDGPASAATGFSARNPCAVQPCTSGLRRSLRQLEQSVSRRGR